MKKAKQRVSFLMGACLLVLLMAFCGRKANAMSAYYSCGDETKWRYDPASQTLYVDGNGAVVVPTWNTIRVNDCNVAWTMKHIVIGSNITELPKDAFANDWTVETVKMGDKVKVLGDYCFYGCNNLKEIRLSKSLTRIGNSCFSICKSLKEITIPKTVTKFGGMSFCNSSLQKVTFEPGTTIVDRAAFTNVTTLTTVILPDSIKYIDEYAFSGCKNLNPFHIPSQLEGIGRQALKDCMKITKIKLPKGFYRGIECLRYSYVDTLEFEYGIKEIPKEMFQYSEKLKKVVLPDSVTVIDKEGFFGCPVLSDITFSKNLSTVNESAFRMCPAVKSIVIPASLVNVKTVLFPDSKIEKLVLSPGRTSIQINICSNLNYIKELILPESLKMIAEQRIFACKGLTQIILPANVNVVDKDAFKNCTALKSVYIKNPNVVLHNGWNNDTGIKTLYGIKGSTAEQYAKSHGLTFVERYRLMTACQVSLPEVVTLTGKALTPAPVVKFGNTTLTAGKDYTVSYQNNVYQGTATVTVSGIGGTYFGSTTKTFRIEEPKRPINQCYIYLPGEVGHNGGWLSPVPSIKYGNETLQYGRDFNVSYSNNINLGRAYVTIQGTGRYEGSVSSSFMIVPARKEWYRVGDIYYKITNASTNGRGTVSVARLAKKCKSITIPKSVKIGGYTYQVTGIEKKAFYKQSKLSYVKIKAKYIGYIGSKAFYQIDKKAKIKVPSKCYKKYEKMIRKSKVKNTVKIKK